MRRLRVVIGLAVLAAVPDVASSQGDGAGAPREVSVLPAIARHSSPLPTGACSAGMGEAAGSEPIRPFRVGLALVYGGSWDLAIRTGSFVNREATYPAGWSVGLRLGYAVLPRLAVAGQAEWNGGGFGDSSGWTLWNLGLEGRPFGLAAVTPLVTGALGRMTESGGVHFGFGAVGAGVDLRLAGPLSGRVALEYLVPFSAGLGGGRGEGQTATVNANLARVHLGLGVRF